MSFANMPLFRCPRKLRMMGGGDAALGGFKLRARVEFWWRRNFQALRGICSSREELNFRPRLLQYEIELVRTRRLIFSL